MMCGKLTFNTKDVSNISTHSRAVLRYKDMDATLVEVASLYY